MEKRRLNVAVTGLNNVDSPGPGIPVIRALKESNDFDIRIIGLIYDTFEPGMYMRELVDTSYLLPVPSAGHEALLARLLYIHEKERIDVIIPNFDAELFNFIKLVPDLDRLGIKSFLPTVDQFEERQKWALPEFGRKCGILVPDSKMIHSADHIPALTYEFGYPLVVKGKYYDAYIAHNPEQALNYFNKLSRSWGLPVIIQKFTAGSEVNLTGIADGKGTLLGAVPMRKTFVTDKGKAWAGISIEDEKLIAAAELFAKKSNWRGGFELEMIRTEDGQYQLIEINPRFPAWVYFATAVGQNHPEQLIKLALGIPVKPYRSYESGKIFIRYSYDQIIDLKQFESIAMHGELRMQ